MNASSHPCFGRVFLLTWLQFSVNCVKFTRRWMEVCLFVFRFFFFFFFFFFLEKKE